MSEAATKPIIIKSSLGLQGHRGPRIPGVLPSVRYGEQVVSTGIPSLDAFIGGGIPLGSICIIKDLFPSAFANCVLKAFLAEGAVYNHHLYLASGGSESSECIMNKLPSSSASSGRNDEDNALIHGPTSEADLKIAWRYGHQQAQKGGSKGTSKFDFSHRVTAADLGAKYIHNSKILESNDKLESVGFAELLQEIAGVVSTFETPGSTIGVKPPSNLVRVGLSHCEAQVFSPGFMPGLRALVRHTNACALLTLSDLSGSPAESLARCEHFADYVIALQTVVDEKRRSELGDIDGICDVLKIASVNSLKVVEPPRDLGFSFKKKRLVFHELHLPPEGENTAQREVSNSKFTQVNPTSSCGATFKGKSIDF